MESDLRLSKAAKAIGVRGKRLVMFAKMAANRFGAWSESTMLEMQTQALENYMTENGINGKQLLEASMRKFDSDSPT